MSTIFLTADWDRLFMLNYPIEPRELQKFTPRGTELDTWNNTAYVSLVAFRFLNTRFKGMAVPFHRDFEEVNLRFYVRSRGPEGWRRGVVFVREVVPRRAIAFVAKWLYNENYVACRTRSTVVDPTDDSAGQVEYSWKHGGKWLAVSGSLSGRPTPPAANSQEEFITEHYWGYSAQRDGGTVEYQVEHPKWTVWAVSETRIDGDIKSFYGPEFASALANRPSSAFLADGSSVIVRKGKRIDEIKRVIGGSVERLP